jgi:nitrile hydratase beta subunit
MDGIADMGGSPGWGRVLVPTPGEPPFAEAWEGRAFALTLLTIGRITGRNLDAFRHALERLDPDDYLADGYYGRWIRAAELMLTESAILAPESVDARVQANGGADVPQPPAPEPAKPDYAPSAPGSLRAVDASPRFAVGDRVRARAAAVPGHTRLPRYVRGHAGVVTIVQPGALLPDTHAHFAGENPQHVYAVEFTSTELWGADAEPFTLTIDLFESYLEAAA